MKNPSRHDIATPSRTQKGAVLLEGLLATLIFSLGILGIIGLQASSSKNITDSKYRLDASFLANQSIGLMWADRSNLAAYEVEDETIEALPNGTRTIDVQGNQVTVTITWQMPGESNVRTYTAIAQING